VTPRPPPPHHHHTHSTYLLTHTHTPVLPSQHDTACSFHIQLKGSTHIQLLGCAVCRMNTQQCLQYSVPTLDCLPMYKARRRIVLKENLLKQVAAQLGSPPVRARSPACRHSSTLQLPHLAFCFDCIQCCCLLLLEGLFLGLLLHLLLPAAVFVDNCILVCAGTLAGSLFPALARHLGSGNNNQQPAAAAAALTCQVSCALCRALWCPLCAQVDSYMRDTLNPPCCDEVCCLAMAAPQHLQPIKGGLQHLTATSIISPAVCNNT